MRLDRYAIATLIVAFALLWPLAHPPRPPLANEDIYDHLAVARHLARGDGFLNDVVYPLSLAYPFAAQVPQPLVHRPPAYPLLLTLPYAAANGDPAGTLVAVRWLLLGALVVTVGLGLGGLARAGQPLAAVPWVLIMSWHPLVALMIDFGREEVVAGSLLLAIWLAHRYSRTAVPSRRVAVATGVLAGVLSLLRAELTWVPWLWWAAFALLGGQSPWRGATIRRLGLAAGTCALLCLPWLARNALLTGNPFFALQSHAELWKWTHRWPNFTVYQQLDPQPGLLAAVLIDPMAIAAKAVRGGLFVLRHFDEAMPWMLWMAMLVLAAARWRRERRCGAGRAIAAGPAGVALATLVPAVAFYALFSPSTKHLTPFVPILVFESCLLLTEFVSRRSRRAPLTVAALAATVALCVSTPPPGMAGWKPLLRRACDDTPRTEDAVRLMHTLSPGPVFIDEAAPLWLADRAGVWRPLDAETEQWIRDHVPGMADAAWVRVDSPPSPVAVVAAPTRAVGTPASSSTSPTPSPPAGS